MSDKILLVGDDHLEPSDEFKAKLKAFDPDLCVSWSRTKHRFVIEQCVEHCSATSEHTHLCRKVYVWMVQDEDKCMTPLGEHVFDKLKQMRANTESFGGATERGLRNFKQYTDGIDEERKAKEEAAMREVARLNSLDNRVQNQQGAHADYAARPATESLSS